MQTIDPQLEAMQSEFERALKALAERDGEQLAARIRPILAANLDRERIQASAETGSVGAYVERVAACYASLGTYIHGLQVERSTKLWEPLAEKLLSWAYNFLVRKNFKNDQETFEIARECANTAAITILEAHFPYDTDFEPWAHVIVMNTCRKFFRSETKKSIIPRQMLVELDEALVGTVDTILAGQKAHEDHSELLDALAQLSDARRQVIDLYYLEETPLPEIAIMLGKSVGAVHSLHFNALQDLRKILGINRDNV